MQQKTALMENGAVTGHDRQRANGHEPADTLRLVLSAPPNEQVAAYAQYLSELLGGRPVEWTPESAASGRSSSQLNGQIPTPLFTPARPQWPIQKILVAIRAEAADEAAIDWVCRLARPSGAAVTMLVVAPPLPAVYRLGSHADVGLPTLLTSNTPAGAQLRQLAQRVAQCQIPATLRLCEEEGEPHIHQEIAAEAYDLIIIGADTRGRLHRLILGEAARPLQPWVGRPALIACSQNHVLIGSRQNDSLAFIETHAVEATECSVGGTPRPTPQEAP